MSWRKWLVRGLVFGIAGAILGAAFLYQRWTNPAAIRQQVLASLQKLFPGAMVTLDSARLEILGGIRFSELRLVRRDDADRTEIAYVPSGVLYHDKEQLLDGKVVLRKIELDQLRLRVARGRDGRWNLEGVAARGKAGTALPTVVVHQGTVILEDQLGPADMVPVEINNTCVSLLNDPVSTVLIEGTGTSEAIGALRVGGTWERDTGEFTLRMRAVGVALSPALVRRVRPYCPDGRLDAVHLEGKADLDADLSYRPASAQPLRYDVRCRLKQVIVQHPQLPMALEQLDARLRCANGKLTLDSLTARAGEAEVQAQGAATLPCATLDFEGALTIKHLALCHELFARLPDNLKKLYDLFEPRGPMTLTLQGACHASRWEYKHCLLHPENASMRFHKFPYLVEGLSGTLDCDLLADVHKIDLAGYSGAQPISLQGTWKGVGEAADVKLDVHALGIPLDEKIIAPLPPALQKLARAFHATGRGDCQAFIRHVPGKPASEFANEYHIQFRDANVKWDGFPYPVENVSGNLFVYPRHWEFKDFQGTHEGGSVAVRGRSFPPREGAGGDVPMVIEIEGSNVAVGADLRGAIQQPQFPGLARAWDTFAPTGRITFAARIERAPGQTPDLDVAVNVRGCSIEPRFFRYGLNGLAGKFRFAGNRLSLVDISASHGGTRLTVGRGTVDIARNGGYYADLADLQCSPLLPDDDFLKAVPPAIKGFLTALKLKDAAVIKTRLVIAQDGETGGLPDVYWDGQLWLRNANLKAGVDLDRVTGTVACTGRHDGRQLLGLNGNLLLEQVSCFNQPFRNVHSKFEVKKEAPDVLLLGLKAPLFGGEVSGQARVEFSSRLRYELDLTLTNLNVEQCSAFNLGPEPRLSGLANGRLYLTGQGTGTESLEGNGKLDVNDGKLVQLPPLLNLLKALGLRSPDHTAFEEVHAVFGIHGTRVAFSQLDLVGNPVSLSGNGTFDLESKDVQMNFYPTWGRSEQLLPSVVRTVPSAISKNLLKIEVRGKADGKPGDLQFTRKPVPVLTDPLLQMRDRMTGKTN